MQSESLSKMSKWFFYLPTLPRKKYSAGIVKKFLNKSLGLLQVQIYCWIVPKKKKAVQCPFFFFWDEIFDCVTVSESLCRPWECKRQTIFFWKKLWDSIPTLETLLFSNTHISLKLSRFPTRLLNPHEKPGGKKGKKSGWPSKQKKRSKLHSLQFNEKHVWSSNWYNRLHFAIEIIANAY